MADTMADGDMIYGGGGCVIEFYDYLRWSGIKYFPFLFYDSYEDINEKDVVTFYDDKKGRKALIKVDN